MDDPVDKLTSGSSTKYIVLVWLLSTTSGVLIPKNCASYSVKHIVNLTQNNNGTCYGDRSAEMTFTITSSPAYLKLDFSKTTNLRTAYLRCNSTDNKAIRLVYNGAVSQMVNLCPDLYPGYYYAQYFGLQGDDVTTLTMALTIGIVNQTCIHGHNSDHDDNLGKSSTKYPQGGVYPIQCALRIWSLEKPIKGTNLAAGSTGAICSYWRPFYGIGHTNYCRRILDGYVDPWNAPFAFASSSKFGLVGSWIKVIFKERQLVSVVSWIQHDHPKIRRFGIENDAGILEYINCSIPLSKDQYMQWEVYDIGPYVTYYITIVISDVDFLPSDRMVVGFYEVEMYSRVTDTSTTTDIHTSRKSDVDPSFTSKSDPPVDDEYEDDDKMENSHSIIIMTAVIVACVLGLSLIVVILVIVVYRGRKKPTQEPAPIVNNPYYSAADFSSSNNGHITFIPGHNNHPEPIGEKPPDYENIYNIEKGDLPGVMYDNAVGGIYQSNIVIPQSEQKVGEYEMLGDVRPPVIETAQYETIGSQMH